MRIREIEAIEAQERAAEQRAKEVLPHLQLVWACREANTNSVQRLLRSGASPSYQSSLCLCEAAKAGSREICAELVAHGAELGVAIGAAAASGDEGSVRALIAMFPQAQSIMVLQKALRSPKRAKAARV